MSTEALSDSVMPSPIAEVWGDLQKMTLFQDLSFDIDMGSSSGATVLLTDGESPSAVKFTDIYNRHDGNLLLREALLLAMLNEADSQPPLQVPKPIDGNFDSPPYYLVMERISGRVLGWPEIRSLSMIDKQALGTAVGGFAAWMALAVSCDQYANVLYDTSTQVFDRAQRFNLYYEWARTVKQMGCLVLYDAFQEMSADFIDGDRYDERPTLIGFDDIRPTNISFGSLGGRWLATGLFDVGIMKPTTPAREFRHLRLISSETAQAAADAYQEKSGQEVLTEDIDFWARLQAITSTVYSVANSTTYTGANQLALKQLFPGEEWTELDRFIV